MIRDPRTVEPCRFELITLSLKRPSFFERLSWFSLFVFFTYGHIWPNLPEWIVYDLKSIFLVFDNCFVCTCPYIHPNTIKIIRVQTYSRFFQIKPISPSHLTLNQTDRGQSGSAGPDTFSRDTTVLIRGC